MSCQSSKMNLGVTWKRGEGGWTSTVLTTTVVTNTQPPSFLPWVSHVRSLLISETNILVTNIKKHCATWDRGRLLFLPSSADLHKAHSGKLIELFSSFSDSADPQVYERNMIHLLCIIYIPVNISTIFIEFLSSFPHFKASRGLKCDYCEYQTKWMSHCHNLT